MLLLLADKGENWGGGGGHSQWGGASWGYPQDPCDPEARDLGFDPCPAISDEDGCGLG